MQIIIYLEIACFAFGLLIIMKWNFTMFLSTTIQFVVFAGFKLELFFYAFSRYWNCCRIELFQLVAVETPASPAGSRITRILFGSLSRFTRINPVFRKSDEYFVFKMVAIRVEMPRITKRYFVWREIKLIFVKWPNKVKEIRILGDSSTTRTSNCYTPKILIENTHRCSFIKLGMFRLFYWHFVNW